MTAYVPPQLVPVSGAEASAVLMTEVRRLTAATGQAEQAYAAMSLAADAHCERLRAENAALWAACDLAAYFRYQSALLDQALAALPPREEVSPC